MEEISYCRRCCPCSVDFNVAIVLFVAAISLITAIFFCQGCCGPELMGKCTMQPSPENAVFGWMICPHSFTGAWSFMTPHAGARPMRPHVPSGAPRDARENQRQLGGGVAPRPTISMSPSSHASEGFPRVSRVCSWRRSEQPPPSSKIEQFGSISGPGLPRVSRGIPSMSDYFCPGFAQGVLLVSLGVVKRMDL